MKSSRDKALLGAAGVFAVCAELNREGYMAMPTTRSMKGVDVLIENHKGVQVKTSRLKKTFLICAGIIGKKSPEEFFRERIQHDFVLVMWSPEEKPSFYVVPQKNMVKLLVAKDMKYKEEHPKTTWTPMKPGVYHVDINQLACYKDNWSLLFRKPKPP